MIVGGCVAFGLLVAIIIDVLMAIGYLRRRIDGSVPPVRDYDVVWSGQKWATYFRGKAPIHSGPCVFVLTRPNCVGMHRLEARGVLSHGRWPVVPIQLAPLGNRGGQGPSGYRMRGLLNRDLRTPLACFVDPSGWIVQSGFVRTEDRWAGFVKWCDRAATIWEQRVNEESAGTEPREADGC